MPPNSNKGGGKKKKKGKAPTHQNEFAFKHNPKSKLTQKILDSPNVHVCKRCHEKIEWKKQYRKYKPRTQPGKCNECQKRNVLAAYHTICTGCTTASAKAKALLEDETRRVCAVCVKELAMRDKSSEDDDDVLQSLGKMRLRERRAIERMLTKDTSKGGRDDDNDNDAADDENAGINDAITMNENDDGTAAPEEGDENEEQPPIAEGQNLNNIDGDEDDPFLKAIGGADKLMAGPEYQQMLLKKQQQQESR